MKKLVIIFLFLLLSACHSNELMCEFTPPDEMTERQFRLCEAMYSGTKIINNNSIKY